jgi:hypothetical protein
MNVNNISLTYRQRFLKNQLAFDKKYRQIFNKVANNFALLSNDPSIKFSKSFKFPPVINKKIKAIIAEFHDKTLTLTEQQIEYSWNLSNDKNDQIVSDFLKTITKIKAAQSAAYFMPNIRALKSFISSDRGAGTLSNAIWRVSDQLRSELETHLGIGLMNGDSANVISQRIRTYLKNPDALFRRVRDVNGKLVASKAMLDNEPGQGVYNSAYKNALRLARTNTNQAFLLADHIRWAQQDMVIGVRIELSAQHKIEDICDDMEGDYPKDFVFVGWHPHCLCHAVPILSDSQNFMDYLKGNADLETEQITDMPDNFVNYTKENYKKLSKYKNLPYWIADNKGIIKDVLKK